MLGLPQTTSEINHYLMAGDYMGGYNLSPSAANVQLSAPVLAKLSRDTFVSCVEHEDKRKFNFIAFGSMLLGVSAAVLGLKCCASKSLELVKDVGKITMSGVKGTCSGTLNCAKKICHGLNPVNWFRKK